MTARRSTLDRARDDLAAAKKRRDKDKARRDRLDKEADAANHALAATDREVDALEAYVAALVDGPRKDATGQPMTATSNDTVTGDGSGHALPDA